MTATAFSVLVLTTGSFLKTTTEINEELSSMARLEAFMNATEEAIRFEAPAVEDNLEVNIAVENLDMLAEETEASLKYEAPAVEENKEVADALENLDMLANSIEKAIRFQAPGVVDTMENGSNQNEDILVAKQHSVSNK